VKPSSRFFRNTACEYFPCHEGADPETFNCLFCYCPLYFLPDCGGRPRMIGTRCRIKDCTGCTLPHGPGGYDRVLARLKAWFAAERARDEAAAPGDEPADPPPAE